MPRVWAPLKPGDIILVDQDDVLADFTGELLRRCQEEMPDENWLPFEAHSELYFYKNYPVRLHAQILAVNWNPGFFCSLQPIPGALDGIKEMLALGLDPLICTSQIASQPTCVQEKMEWIIHYLGRDFARRTGINADKTTVRGRILIDNRPEITGRLTPEWEHVLYDRPHNRHVVNKRRLTWQNWKQTLLGEQGG